MKEKFIGTAIEGGLVRSHSRVKRIHLLIRSTRFAPSGTHVCLACRNPLTHYLASNYSFFRRSFSSCS
jgi:hypothetical protein